jgi:hypothetical protein
MRVIAAAAPALAPSYCDRKTLPGAFPEPKPNGARRTGKKGATARALAALDRDPGLARNASALAREAHVGRDTATKAIERRKANGEAKSLQTISSFPHCRT